MNFRSKKLFTSIGVLGLGVFYYLHLVGGPSFYFSWMGIRTGESKELVFEKLGTPTEEGLHLLMREDELTQKEAGSAGDVEFFSWVRGDETIYLIKFDERDHVEWRGYRRS